MSWEDRLTQAVYTSPSGLEFTAVFEDVSKVLGKKATPFDFPDVPGTYVQDLGKKGRRYPMRWIFWGEDYDQVSELFDSAIEEKGPGILQHPLYGTFDVVAVGDIKRTDSLVTAANQAVYDLTFYETIKIIFPISDLAAENAMIEGFSEYSQNVIENYNQSLSIETAQETSGYIASAKAGLRKIKREMASIAATTAEIERDFNDVFSIADDAITTLAGGPLLIGAQMLALTRLPSQAASNIRAKLEAYSNLLGTLISGSSNQFSMGLDSQAGNSFANNNLIASSVVLSAIESTISESTMFATRRDAIEAQEALEQLLTDYITWADTNREGLIQEVLPTREPGTNDLIDTGESYQNLLEVFAISQGRLTEIAFTALQERSVILDRDTLFITFCAEKYGVLDPKYDFVIQTCKLSGAELWEIKKGREMVYYV